MLLQFSVSHLGVPPVGRTIVGLFNSRRDRNTLLTLRRYLQLHNVCGFNMSRNYKSTCVSNSRLVNTPVNDRVAKKRVSAFVDHRILRDAWLYLKYHIASGEKLRLVRTSDDPLSRMPEANRGGLPWTGFLVVRKFH